MAMVRKHEAEVSEVRRLLDDLYVLTLLTCDRPFRYRPGQFLHLAVEPYDPSRPWPDSRCFSILSPPSGSAQQLDLAFSVKGAFTTRMATELSVGRRVWLKMPYGELFADDHASAPCVFLAGGTGVTPFLSLFLDDSFVRYQNAVLYLGVRSRPYHVFADQLAQAQAKNPHFSVEVRFEDEAGRLVPEELVTRHGVDAQVFLSGPPAMLRGLRAELTSLGIHPKHIHSDDWE